VYFSHFYYYLKLFQNVKYEKILKHKFVFKEGDPSNDKYYVIIFGKVGIYEKKQTVFETSNLSKIFAKQISDQVIVFSMITIQDGIRQILNYKQENTFQFNYKFNQKFYLWIKS